MRFWANEQPHSFTQRPLHSEKPVSLVMIDPYVFNDTVNSQQISSEKQTCSCATKAIKKYVVCLVYPPDTHLIRFEGSCLILVHSTTG